MGRVPRQRVPVALPQPVDGVVGFLRSGAEPDLAEEDILVFQRILVGVDLSVSESSSKTLETAAYLAKSTGAHIRLIYVRYTIDLAMNYIPATTLETDEKHALDKLRELADTTGLPPDRISVVSPIGRVYSEVLSAAEDFKADLIVAGPHSPSMAKYLLGTDAARIVKHAPISVLVVR